MKKLVVLILLFSSQLVFGQTESPSTDTERRLIFGLGIGMGTLELNTNDSIENSLALSLPNIKIGYKLNHRLALMVLLPGANYEYQEKDRGFEGILLAGQYWVSDDWWLLAGAGLTFDAAAFYTVEDPSQAEFYFGAPALSAATGYEIYEKGRFKLDLQYRYFYGESKIANDGFRRGSAHMFILGFNWN